jgi:hypothetical protein
MEKAFIYKPKIRKTYVNKYNFEGKQYCLSLGVRNKDDAINIRSIAERVVTENRDY